ncbi:dienelactone hydrolase family protein [Reyranella sp.]|jgi:dienelactone hydrolase|uniref:dienelactone hydrolase family protein n=1 Tax=Reyranella sp. TaxID=1929291 RepID=UPI002F93E1B8
MRSLPALCLIFLIAISSNAIAQEKVQFASRDGDGSSPPTQLDGYLFRPPDAVGTFPAVVFLHGCGGLISSVSHRIMSREMDWAGKLNDKGIGVLMVDSLTPRGSGEICSRSGFKEWLYRRRPADAYGALVYLQALSFVQHDRIGLVGWSNGGGATLFAVGTQSRARPAAPAGPDFAAAVAFYPGSCNEQRLGSDWTTSIPLLVLIGELDVWTPAAPCRQVVDRAAARGAPVEIHAYPGAYHDFDWPGAKHRELVAYTTRAGVVPIVGEDPAAHADAIRRVEAFFTSHLLH